MAIKGGYYIKARCTRDSWIAHSAPVVRETWDYLLREANHKERKYNGYVIKRGQLFRSYSDIRDALHWMAGNSKRKYSVDQVKHTMKLLVNNLMITIVNTPRGCIITVCKYDYYQDSKNYESTTVPPMNTKPNTQRIPSPSTTINKNVKNDKNEKENTTSGEVILEIPLIKKDGIFKIYQNDIAQWKDTFPAVDILSVLKIIKLWNIDHPENRKTKGGIRKHISTWLGKEQNKAPKIKKTTALQEDEQNRRNCL